MTKITSMQSFKMKDFVMTLYLLSGLLLFDNVTSRQHWNRDYLKVNYDAVNRAVIMTFEIIDYYFGPCNENGYLRVCDFAYSADGVNYTHLMRAETHDQKLEYWSWLNMRYKRDGAQIQFLGCFKPERGSFWPDNTDVRVEVGSILSRAGKNTKVWASNTVKWTPGPNEQDVKYIRITGFWKVNGVYIGDNIKGEVYEITEKVAVKSKNLQNSPLVLNSEANNAISDNVEVYSEADAIVIKGAGTGKNIKVYTISGEEVKSIITSSDVIKLKLPKNQVYIINIGQARYKAAL